MSVSKYKVKGGYKWRYNISRRDPITGKNCDICRRGFTNEKMAKKAEKIMREEISNNERKGITEITDRITINEVFDMYIIKKKRTAELTTLSTYETNYNKWFRDRIGNKKIVGISDIYLEEFFDSITPKMSYTSLKDKRVLLSMIFKFALERGIIDRNPVLAVSLLKDKSKESTNKKEKVMTKEELKLLFATLKNFLKTQSNYIYDRDYIFFYLQALTGVRISELITLRWEDIDFQNQTVSINKAQKSAYGKTYEGKTKTISTNRMIIIKSEKFWKYLKKWKVEQNELKKKVGNTPNNKIDTLIFHNVNKSKRLAKTFYRNLLNKLFKKNPDLTPITPHSFRHTIISLLRIDDNRKDKVEFYLGQKTGTATIDGYTHWGLPTMKEIAEEIAKIYDELI